MSFSEALTLMIHGHRLTRSIWKNKGAHVRHAVDQNKDEPPANYFGYFDENAVVSGRQWSEYKPTHADMTAEDWSVLPDSRV